ncbi:MAG: hypothetical protein AAGA30_04960 [Planctomycetota bacterium]
MKKPDAETKPPLENDFDSLSQGIDDSLLRLIQKSEGTSTFENHSTSSSVEGRYTATLEKPTEALNTRIPKSLDDAIADWLYQSRKQGQPITKQQLAIDALTHYLDTKTAG